MGLKNGTCFIQTIPHEGKIYFMEMGFRFAGGMMYKVLEPMWGFNDVKMMLRYAVGGEMVEEGELQYTDMFKPRVCGGQFCMPLNAGTIARIENLEMCKAIPEVKNVLHYYYEGDTVEERVLGTLGSHLCRFTILADTVERYLEVARQIQNTIKVYDTEGNVMNTLKMDFGRMK